MRVILRLRHKTLTFTLSMQNIRFTLITAGDCSLTKTYAQKENDIEATAIAHMTQGHARIVNVPNVADFMGTLPLLTADQAITCGIPAVGDTALTTRAGTCFRPDAVARTNESFVYPDGPTLFPIDVDVDEDRFQSVASVLDALEACSPWLTHVARAARPSASSYVASRGLRGVHVYLAITRGSDVPILAERLQMEQWSAGYGAIKISRSGALLVRQLSDALIYQPSRLIFEAAPICQPPIERNVPPDQLYVFRDSRSGARYIENSMLDVRGMPPVKEIERRRFEAHIRNAKLLRRGEAKRVAINYQIQNAIASGESVRDGERFGLLATRALESDKLPLSWAINVKDIGIQTVAQILAAGEAACGHQCADPFDTWRQDLQPKHFGKAEICCVGDRMGVWSHKMHRFFEFTKNEGADLIKPIQQAAEKLVGCVEFPEPMSNSKVPYANVQYGVELLLTELGATIATDLTSGKIFYENVPEVADWVYALSRIGCTGITPGLIVTSFETLSKTRSVDPWRDAVLRLPAWDGQPRLDNFFVELCGEEPSEALLAVTQLWFSGIIQRQLQPGAPVPVVPVLIGGMGSGKSQFAQQVTQALGFPSAPEVAFEDIIRMTMNAATSPVAELAEMSGLSRRSLEEVRMWITDTKDVYRMPYARFAEPHPRRFTLIGTANKHELNRDPDGNRRTFPIVVRHDIDPNWTKNALQVFAEAKFRIVDTPNEYIKLVRRAATLVFEFNKADMVLGRGAPVSDLDDLLPDILKREIELSGPRVASKAIRYALDMLPSGRRIHAREYASWLRTRGWIETRNAKGNGWTAPQSFLDDIQYATHPVTDSPFDIPATH